MGLERKREAQVQVVVVVVVVVVQQQHWRAHRRAYECVTWKEVYRLECLDRCFGRMAVIHAGCVACISGK